MIIKYNGRTNNRKIIKGNKQLTYSAQKYNCRYDSTVCPAYLHPYLAINHSQVNRIAFRIFLFGVIVSIIAGYTLIPRGPIRGPLAIVWQSATGFCCLYLFCLLYALFQGRTETIRLITTYIDPYLTLVNYSELTYG